MRILRNYILKEFFGPFFVCLAVLTLVMLLGNLVRLAELIIYKGVNIISVSKLFIFLIPALLPYTLPLAALFAVLLSVGRLTHDNEIIAMRASGLNILRLIIIPLLIVGLILSLILFVFNDRIIPYAHFAWRRTLGLIGIKNPASFFEAGTFIDAFDKYIIFVYRIQANKLYQVRIYEPQPENKPCRTIVAKEGEFISIPEQRMVKLKLIEGTSDEPDLNNPQRFYKLNFKTLFLNLRLTQTKEDEIQKKPKDMTFKEINRNIKKYKASGIKPLPLLTELHKRAALAFSVMIFIPLGVGLAILTGRREKSINFSMALAIAVIYYLLLLAASALALQGYLKPAFTMWLPNIILAALAFLLSVKVCAY